MGRPELESKRLFRLMVELGTGHPNYQWVKDEWHWEVAKEWARMERILSRDEQEQYLAGCEVKVAESLERIAKDVENG